MSEFQTFLLRWIILIVVLLALVVAINMVADRFDSRIDLTEGKIYTLSPWTKKILEGIRGTLWILKSSARVRIALPCFFRIFFTRSLASSFCNRSFAMSPPRTGCRPSSSAWTERPRFRS